jgi:hypothetical protein
MRRFFGRIKIELFSAIDADWNKHKGLDNFTVFCE